MVKDRRLPLIPSAQAVFRCCKLISTTGIYMHDDVIDNFVGIEYVSIIHDSIIGAWLNTTQGRCANCEFVHFV